MVKEDEDFNRNRRKSRSFICVAMTTPMTRIGGWLGVRFLWLVEPIPKSRGKRTTSNVIQLAATIAPLANVLSIAALVTYWRMDVSDGKGGVVPDFEGEPYKDPRW
jgi:hypothetical protein